MTLLQLVESVAGLAPEAAAVVAASLAHDAVVTGITHDSRAVGKGYVFVAVPGLRADGAAFAAEAVKRGAVAVVAERDPRVDPAGNPLVSLVAGHDLLWIPTPSARVVLPQLAATFHGHPSRDLRLVGVTGTNGKTTITYLLASVFDAAGWPAGRLGTVTFRVGPSPAHERDASHTTPEASDVQKLLREMADRGCQSCAMEVSSHALALHRADQLTFSAAIFTNLTRDHLDFHGDMAHYFAAKRRLFEMLPPGTPAIVNVDDPSGVELARSLPCVVSYGIDKPADVRPVRLALTLEGVAFEAETPAGTVSIRSSLVGRPNVSNILAVVAAATALGVPTDAIERGVSALDRVPGRFEIVSSAADDVTVVVDYAHTDDALKHLLETARALTTGHVVTVFGCGGDRDRSKRPLMGAVAARLSDRVVLTSDNPRSEDPVRIIDDVMRGLAPTQEPGAPHRPGTPVSSQPDRKLAIEDAIRSAGSGDVVIIAGKGHEKYQVIKDRTVPFDDVEVARLALAGRRAASSV